MTDYRIIDSADALDKVVDVLSTVERYALDTEFHRERTYYPKVALVQIAWPGDLVLIDPLAVSLEPLAAVLESPALAVMHAADQDLEVLELATGAVPRHLFDTQVAAGFIGMSTPSLAALHDSELGLRLTKGDRLTDWLRRPLGSTQLSYAADDVANLCEIHDLLTSKLERMGRLGWAELECEELRTRDRSPRDPDDAWLRIKEAKHLRGQSTAIAAELAAWRERRAADIDTPPRYVLSDMAVVGIAQRNPSTVDQLRGLRGVDDRQLKGEVGRRLLDVVAKGRERPAPPARQNAKPQPQRELRPAVSLLSAWVSQLAKDLELDPALLASRADIEALVRGDADGRLADGWRAEVACEAINRLLHGEAALAFERGRGLVLEDRR